MPSDGDLTEHVTGDKYVFRVVAMNEYGPGTPAEIGPVAATSAFVVPSAPDAPTVTDVSTKHCALTWKTPSNDGGTPVIGYVLERRVGLTGTWVPLNQQPITELTHKDETVDKGVEYQYRVIAVNAVGMSMPSSPCSVVKASDKQTGKKYMVLSFLEVKMFQSKN